MSTSPATTFAEITALLPELPALSAVPEDFVGSADQKWLGQAQHRFPPRLTHPRLSLFCALHGHAGIVDFPALLVPWQTHETPTAKACATADADLKIYELASQQPTGDITQGPALTEAAAAHAMAFGMMLGEPGLDLLMLSTLQDVETGGLAAASAVIAALLKQDAAQLNLPPALTTTVDAALAANRAALTDPLTIAATLGGYEICAMIGAILSARLAKIPVLVEGLPALAATLVIGKLTGTQSRDLLAHVRATSAPAALETALAKMIVILPAAQSVPAGDGAQAVAALQAYRILA